MAGSPKYLNRQNMVEQISEGRPEKDIPWNLFIKSCKGKGVKQAKKLREILMRPEYAWGWDFIALADIEHEMGSEFKIENSRWIYLLKKMEKYQIIRKKIVKDSSLKTPKKERTYYQYSSDAETPTLTEEGYKKEYFHQIIEIQNLEHRLYAAMDVLNQHQLLKEYFKECNKGMKWITAFPALKNPEEYVKSLHPKMQYLTYELLKKGVADDLEELLIISFEKGVEVCYANRDKGKNFPIVVTK